MALTPDLRPSVSAGGAPAPWAPSDLSGLVLDLRPTVATYQDTGLLTLALDGHDVASWRDQSGAGHHATQSNSGRRPTRRDTGLGGGARPRLEFDGASDGLLLTGWGLGSGGQTVALEFARRVNTISSRLLSLRSGGYWMEIALVNFGGYAEICLRFGDATGGSGAAVGWSPTLGTGRHTLEIYYDGSGPGTTGAYAVYLDGTLATLSTTGVLADSAQMGGLGSCQDASVAATVDVGRVLAYGADHRTNRTLIKTWLDAA